MLTCCLLGDPNGSGPAAQPLHFLCSHIRARPQPSQLGCPVQYLYSTRRLCTPPGLPYTPRFCVCDCMNKASHKTPPPPPVSTHWYSIPLPHPFPPSPPSLPPPLPPLTGTLSLLKPASRSATPTVSPSPLPLEEKEKEEAGGRDGEGRKGKWGQADSPRGQTRRLVSCNVIIASVPGPPCSVRERPGTKASVTQYNNIIASIYNRMKSTLKVHNPRVIILLICINDVQGKELSF